MFFWKFLRPRTPAKMEFLLLFWFFVMPKCFQKRGYNFQIEKSCTLAFETFDQLPNFQEENFLPSFWGFYFEKLWQEQWEAVPSLLKLLTKYPPENFLKFLQKRGYSFSLFLPKFFKTLFSMIVCKNSRRQFSS